MTPRIGLIVLSIAAAGACGTTVQPQNAEGPAAAIRAAEEVGAERVPEAALRLQLAKEQLERAKTMTSERQQGGAALLMMRSQADAELAVALARSTAARQAAHKAQEKTRNLQNTVR
jgi:phage terminase large subunit-like protein